MKRVLEVLFPPKPNPQLAQEIQRQNRVLEQVRQEHRESTKRADKAMEESVKIAKEALEQRGR